MSILITGGGTGGHLAIAKAIKEELNKRDLYPIFVGSKNGQDLKWFKDDEGWSEKYFFDTFGVVNRSGFAKIKSLYNIFLGVLKVKSIFKKHNVNVVFSVGGYSAASASFASILFRKPLFIHEQNAIMGRLNALLKPYAKRIFENDARFYPIRDIFFENRYVRDDIKTIIFLGGSQGAKAINEYAISIADNLKQKGINIIHQCGENDFERVKEFYEKADIKADCFAFSSTLDEKIKKADFAICRAGASTLWELVASGVPALYIPYPYAALDHQYHNAKFLADKNLSYVARESELKEFDIDKILSCNLRLMSEKLQNLIQNDAAKNIVNEILKSL